MSDLLLRFCQLLYDSQIGTSIRESVWTFPILETVHVLAMTLLVGTIALFDLRLLGVVLKRERVTNVARQLLPITWLGFGVMFVTGFLLFWAEAAKSYTNPAFRAKVLLLALVGLNPLIFHLTVYRRVEDWDLAKVTPVRARMAAYASLFLWTGIVVTGRAIAYF